MTAVLNERPQAGYAETAYQRVIRALRDNGSRILERSDSRAEAQCPAHQDDEPSLGVTGIEGQALIFCQAGCDTRDVVAAIQLTMADLYDEKSATYRYNDGRTVHRYYDSRGKKKFTQNGAKPTAALYHLQHLADLEPGSCVIHLVEGEKDVHAIEAAGGVATTAPQGARSFHKADVTPLTDHYVAVIVDRDDTGKIWAQQVAAKLDGVAKTVRFYQAKRGKDAADHIAAGFGLTDFERIEVEPVAPYEPREVDGNTKPDKEIHRGQLRWALRFAERHRGEFIHTPGRGWLTWTGSHWKEVGEASPTRAVLKIVREAFADLAYMEGEQRKDLLRDISSGESNAGVKGILGLASALDGIAYDDDQFDRHPDLFVFRNGTYDLMTDEFRPSRPEDLITKVAGCDYDPAATSPIYDAVLERAQPKPEMRAYIQRIGGSAMQGRSTEQTLPLFYGKGANGKGTVLNDSWLPVFGDYGKVMGVEVLMSNPTGNTYLPQKAALAGARLVVTSEPDAGMKFSGGTMKMLTGGNPLDARALYRMPIKVPPTWQIVMECNTRPAPPADDDAVWRRLRQVGWDVVIPEGERDATLGQKLAVELSGIANRLLEGWRSYRDEGGIRAPETVQAATREWRDEVDTIGQFVADECFLAAQHTVKSSRLYGRWKQWCKENGEDAGSNKAFTEKVKRKGFKSKRTKNGVFWSGLTVPDSEDDD